MLVQHEKEIILLWPFTGKMAKKSASQVLVTQLFHVIILTKI